MANEQGSHGQPVNPMSGLVRSFLLGPLRQLIPAGLNVLLMPVLVYKGGLYVVGLWGIYNLFINIFQLGNLGVSQFVCRVIADGTSTAKQERETAEKVITFWLLCATALAVVALVFRHEIVASQNIAVSSASTAAIVLLFIAGFCSLLSLLFMFMHVSVHRVPYAQVNQVVAAAVQFVVAIVLIQFVPAYLALVVAITACYLVQAAGLYRNLVRIGFGAAPLTLRWPPAEFMLRLVWKAKGFSVLWAAQLLFLIVNRAGVLVFAGTTVLGAYEVASRVPFLLEQAFSNGLQPLLAIYAENDWRGERERCRIGTLSQSAYRLLAITSVGCLAAWIVLAGPAIGLWLNIADPAMVFATQLFAVFNAIRAYSSPSFWAMQARGQEMWIGVIYLTQALLFLILLFVLSSIMTLTFPFIAILITVLSVITEVTTWIVAERQIGFLSMAVKGWRGIMPFVGGLALLIGGFAVAAPVARRANAIAVAVPHAVPYAVLFVGVVLLLTSGNPIKFIRDLR